MFELITKEKCPFCTKAKKLLTENNLEFKELIIGKDVTRDGVIALYPTMKTVPIIIYQGKLIGGYEDSVETIQLLGNKLNSLKTVEFTETATHNFVKSEITGKWEEVTDNV